MAEGEGFEPPVRLPVRLISSQVPLTTQPPFRTFVGQSLAGITLGGKFISPRNLMAGRAREMRFPQIDREKMSP